MQGRTVSRLTIPEIEALLNKTFFPAQLEFFEGFLDQQVKKACLYHRPGAGKSISALVALYLDGYDKALVIAPPVTHGAWQELAATLSMQVKTISHMKFRMKSFKPSRTVPVICDEFHLLGGQGAVGWTKFDRMAASLQAPVVIASATPNYNDAERCYCIQHVLNPASTRGGFLQFIYSTCQTRQNPFGLVPIVEGFLQFASAEEYLASLPGVYYLPDDQVYTIADVPIPGHIPDEFETFGLSRRTGRIMASQMEERWQRTYQALLDDQGNFRDDVYETLTQLVANATTPVLMFCASSTLALALAQALEDRHVPHLVVTGKTPKARKLEIMEEFKRGQHDVLVGTATMATGADGLDQMCDMLILVHDTDDDSLRRQLVGRILPRGAGGGLERKQLYRLVRDDS